LFPRSATTELGIDFALHKIARQRDKRPLLRFDPFLDFEKFADTMLATRRMGILTIGGGVPRNWSQQFGVYAELLARRGYKKLPLKRYNYGVRICPGAGPLGRPERQYLHGSGFLGKVRAAGRRRPFRGSIR